MARFLVAWLCALVSCASGVEFASSDLAAAEKFALKLTPESTQRLQREQKTEQHLKIGGGNVESKSTLFSVVVRKFSPPAADGSLEMVDQLEVLQTTIDIAGTTYEFDSANPDTQPGEAGLRPLADLLRTTFRTPVTTKFSAKGDVVDVSIPAEARANLDVNYAELFDAERMKRAAIHERSFLPHEEVSVGDQWERTRESHLGSGQTLSFQMEFVYRGTVEEAGQTLHHITLKPVGVTYSMDPNSPSPLKVTESKLVIKSGEGDVYFDQERGVVVREASLVKVAGTLTFVAGGQTIPGEVEFEITSKSLLQP